MAEYIEREALIEDIDAAMDSDGMGYVVGQTMKRYIKRQTAADVAPVRHGRWLRISGMAPPEYHGRHMCSICYARAFDMKFHEELSDYCPNCGARMDLEET